MAKQTFTTGQVLTAAQMTSLQQSAMLGGAANAKVASYVLVAADAGDAITMSNASATTITVNTGLFAAGDIVTIINLGAGVCTITAGTATVATSGSLALAQNQGGVLRFTSASAAIFFQFATPASGDIEGVTAGTGISGGGTSGTVTVTNSMATAIDAKGDLVVGTGADAFARLPVGANTFTLVADSAEATGLKWAAPAGGGKLLQVIFAEYSTPTTVASTSYTDSGLSASITPSSATSKVLISTNLAYGISRSNTEIGLGQNLVRTSTGIFDADADKKGELIGVAGAGLVILDGHTPLPLSGVGSLVVFYGNDEGLRNRAGMTIRTGAELERAAALYAREPVPQMVLKSNGTALPADRIAKLLESWGASRRNRTTAFLNADISLETLGFDPEKLQLASARSYIATELARALGIPAYFIDAETGSSMTYSNAATTRQTLLDFSLIPLMNSITERLSMPDFVPSTQRVEYALDDYLRGSALERAQIYEILNRVGALSAEEIRIQEEMIR